MHCRQSILFSLGSAWAKKSSPQFDVAMGSFAGAEVCELVGLYILYHLSSVIADKMNIGLYKDDGLAILEATLGPKRIVFERKSRSSSRTTISISQRNKASSKPTFWMLHST